MKRIVVLLLALALVVGAVLFFFTRRGITEGAQLLPANSVVYFTIPDVQRTMGRWPKTALAQIGAEPAVADFLSKPMQQAFLSGGSEGLDLLFRVKPGRLFLGITVISQTGAQGVLGFEFFGGKKNLDTAMERLHHEIAKGIPGAKAATVDYKGDTITTFGAATPVVFSASHGSWGFISNNELALQLALDRAAGREKSESLAESANFKKVLGHLSVSPDLLWYAQPDQIFELLSEMGKAQGAAMNTKQLEQMRQMKAIGGTLLLDGADQKEVTFVLYPDAPKIPAVNHTAMALTTSETMLYYEASTNWEVFASEDYLGSLPPEATAFLTQAGIDLKSLPKTFTPELGLAVNWGGGAGLPSVLFGLEVKDRAAAETLLNKIFTLANIQPTQITIDGATVSKFPQYTNAALDPAVAVSDKWLLVTPTSGELERVVSAKPGSATLESTEAFKPALGVYKESAQAFGYVDAKAIFERVYNMARPIAIIAGTMSPAVSQVVDVNKLPDTEVISKHLNPILYTNKQVADGMIIESSGPITLSQAVVLVAGGAGASMAAKKASGF